MGLSRYLVILCVVFSSAVCHGQWLSGMMKMAQAVTLTDKQMAEYVGDAVRQMDSQATVLGPSTTYGKRLARLTAGLKSADGIPLNFKVYKTQEINAFACPDGSVRVYSGLMDMMTDNELLGIIGHEIGHVVKRHSKNALRNQLVTSAVRDGLVASGGRLGRLSASVLGDVGESLMSARFSRKQENEADDCGYDFLVRQKRNPYAMAVAFEKMMATEKGNSRMAAYVGRMFASHPDTRSRIAHIKERCRKDGYGAVK